MAEKRNVQTVNVVLRPASLALKIMVAVLLLSSIAALAALNWVHTGLQAQTEELRREAAAIEYANSVLTEKTGQSDSIQNIQAIAEQSLGLVSPDAVLIDPIS